jgi:cytochrome c heme-lyase
MSASNTTAVTKDVTRTIFSRPIDDRLDQPPALSYPPASIEEAAQHAQTPQADKRIRLGTDRQVSSIPRGDLTVDVAGNQTAAALPPPHQHTLSPDTTSTQTNNHWIYPSEQQLYNAMRRKGWTNVPEDSISTVLNIHNHINERTWQHIQDWEGNQDLRLMKFQGRPTEPSPKAYVLCHLFGIYDKPFDRHDWYVQQVDTGVEQRYVIDYYYVNDDGPGDGQGHGQSMPRPFIDARPALDHPRAVYLRGKQLFREAFPAISRRLMTGTRDATATEARTTAATEASAAAR